MAFFRVQGEIHDYTEDYIEAKSKKEAIEKAEMINDTFFDSAIVEKIPKKEYEEYS